MTELDDAARRLSEGAAHPPYLYAMGPDDARLALDLMQSPPELPPGLDHRTTLIRNRHVHLVVPQGAVAAPIILYVHGGGWVLGGWSTHHRLATTLARRTGAVVVMPEYSRVPEARYPAALDELAIVLETIRAGDLSIPGDPHRIALVGDCAGATLALSLALRPTSTPPLLAQALLYPIGRPDLADSSAIEFATGAGLRLADVRRLCHEYAPRGEPEADPLTAADAHLAGLPPTLLITAEADVTRDRAEAFGSRLRSAGVPVTATRYLGTVHDFAVLDALRWTSSATSALTQLTDFLRAAFTETAAPTDNAATQQRPQMMGGTVQQATITPRTPQTADKSPGGRPEQATRTARTPQAPGGGAEEDAATARTPQAASGDAGNGGKEAAPAGRTSQVAGGDAGGSVERL